MKAGRRWARGMVRVSKLRSKILHDRGVELEKHTRRPVQYANLPVPYKKTRLMQLLEFRRNAKLEDFLFEGTIYQAEKKLKIDCTTIHKWRVLILKARSLQFWGSFDEQAALQGLRERNKMKEEANVSG